VLEVAVEVDRWERVAGCDEHGQIRGAWSGAIRRFGRKKGYTRI
jgi:hypothetical protein